MLRVSDVSALEILDSRGNPTVSVTVVLSDGTIGFAHVPSGASTGRHEALELRDGDPQRYGGRGVRRALANVEQVLGPGLRGFDAEDQARIDRRMVELDGTADKSRLGANSILGVSCAVARTVANARGIPLWRSLNSGQRPRMPVPMVNIISGGLHAGEQIEIQDFLVIPREFASFAEALEAIACVYRDTGRRLTGAGYHMTGVADEGGWGPALNRNEIALTMLDRDPRMDIAIDVAASHFFACGGYHLRSEGRTLSSVEMIDMLESWCARYRVISLEDGLAEDDWDGWQVLTKRLGTKVRLIGDDLFTTNPQRLQTGIERGIANAVLVKMNQIGTLTETFEVIRIAREAHYAVIVSARSGETEDSFLADLAVGSGADQIKIGSVTRSERLAKYNRLLEIEASAEWQNASKNA